MSYTTNPYLPRVRMQAVLLYRQGWSTRQVARHLGYSQSVIVKWIARAPEDGRHTIPTLSSRPHSHPASLSPELAQTIKRQRLLRGRCAEVVHKELQLQGIQVSLSSVKRTLERQGLTRKRSPWKRRHLPLERPEANNPGDLVQVDSIFIVPLQRVRFYVYTLLDVYSRWAYAKVSLRLNTYQSLQFVHLAQTKAPFSFQLLQSDNGQEFSSYFSENVQIIHRHSRVRTPNDNAHLERFNRTLQEECLRHITPRPADYQKAIQQYLPYYNQERLHLGLNLKTPIQVIPSY